MNEINKIKDTHIGASIARSAQIYNNKFGNCIFTCEDNSVLRKYFPEKKKLVQDDIEKVYFELHNKFVRTIDELSGLAKRECVHRSEIEALLQNIRDTYYAYDDFAIVDFKADYPRCKWCSEVIIKGSKSFKDTCSKCDKEVYLYAIKKCGISALEDILKDAQIDPKSDLEEIVQTVMRDKRVCCALIDRYRKLLDEGRLIAG